ncbi:vanillate demethylase subunit A [Kushneria sinocarnis]|uniref:Vanillate demethylase subunit A n=1 Tax=Kushneria sinocarnis TaxID=595502 RepID=A0A420WWC6_9GAMM|nr:aromatic ring-hydroxylating dioxygenase subunit alpha [Kushneria sinocarnis]RKR03415.1 vanillate demethylase subunit A [Kushneria sinocarnis]
MTESSWPRNAWYAAAWSSEIEHELNARCLCDTHVVLYRRSDGDITALEDACWHRLLPLSLGKLDGDQVMCGYHGLKFDGSGRCTFMPSQPTINPSACVRAFPVVERHSLVWLWMGDPALADTDRVPDFHWNDDPQLAGRGGTFYSLACDYRLVVDNLMDLTHETFVHAGSIGHDAITRAPFDVTHTEREVTMERWMRNIDAPPFWARQLECGEAPVDRWHLIHFQAPSTVVGDVGIAHAGTGAPEGDRSQGVTGYFLAAITPETATTCHYFWNFVRDHHLADPQWTEYLHCAHVNDTGQGVYQQDEAVLEAQQKAVDRYDRAPFYNLNIDAGAMWARRLIDRMIEAEQIPRSARARTGESTLIHSQPAG